MSVITEIRYKGVRYNEVPRYSTVPSKLQIRKTEVLTSLLHPLHHGGVFNGDTGGWDLGGITKILVASVWGVDREGTHGPNEGSHSPKLGSLCGPL